MATVGVGLLPSRFCRSRQSFSDRSAAFTTIHATAISFRKPSVQTSIKLPTLLPASSPGAFSQTGQQLKTSSGCQPKFQLA
jgi:hypothetical protein